MKEKCENCKYWENPEEGRLNNLTDGKCHRYPRQIWSSLQPDDYPLANRDDWCGEWKSKEAE